MEMPAPSETVLSRKEQIVARLREVLPQDAVIDDPSETRAYECDGLSAYREQPLLVLLPLTIPSDWTQDVPARYGYRHPGMERSLLYPPVDSGG